MMPKKLCEIDGTHQQQVEYVFCDSEIVVPNEETQPVASRWATGSALTGRWSGRTGVLTYSLLPCSGRRSMI